MKKICIGFVLGISFLFSIAAIRQTPDGILITGGFGGESKFSASQNDQSADWILFKSNGVAVFEVPANGVLPQIYGGTGTNDPGATIPVFVVFTGTNGLFYTNQILGGLVQ